ncbi:MAG: DNA-3-methyladenine glycosylase [Tenuifilaceae bacterium]
MKNSKSFNDPILNKIIQEIELPELTKTKDIYLDMVEVIISQQLSGNVAKVIYNRFLDLFENKYPTPKVLFKTDDQVLRSAGLSNSKAKYVKNLAEFALKNDLSVKHIDSLSDEEIIENLTQIKGIGKWSVEMLLMFSLQRPDVFPYDDLVIKKSMVEVYGIKKEGKELIKKMSSIAEKWRPNRSLASRYLWAHYGLKMKQVKKK